MPQVWHTVRVFVSSTFHDMQAERDYLVRFVFPQLREVLVHRRIHLVDVDLRWGVTSDQDVLSVCREIVDECKPRFVCILGGRYGTVPPGLSRSITEDEIHYGVLDKPRDCRYAFFYFRDPATTAAIAERERGEFREPPGSPEEELLATLKEKISTAGLKPFVYRATWDADANRLVELQDFGRRVYADLLASVDDEFPDHVATGQDPVSEDEAAMEAIVEEYAQHFVLGTRKSVLDEMMCHAKGHSSTSYMGLVGESGSGKSAMMAYFIRHWLSLDDDTTLLVTHFVGTSAASTDARKTLIRLCRQLSNETAAGATIPEEPEKLRAAFLENLTQACEHKRVILVIDGVDGFEYTPQLAGLTWLPQRPPENARFVVSLAPGPTLDLLRRRQAPIEIELPPLNKSDGELIIRQFLRRYHKTIPDEQVNLLLAKTDAVKPLYLLTALEELRTLGKHMEIAARIERLPCEIWALFAWILRRLEKDDGFRNASGKQIGKELVARFASLIDVSRHGLSQQELGQLLAPGNPTEGKPVHDAQGNVAALLRLLRPYLINRGLLIDFHHQQFHQAVEAIYLDNNEKKQWANRVLAEHFDRQHSDGNVRKLEELPWHRLQARQWGELEALLLSPQFMTAKVESGLSRSLVSDFIDAGRVNEDDSDSARILVNLPLLGNCLAEVIEKIEADPSSVGAQLCYELKNQTEAAAASLIAALEFRLDSSPWLRHVATHGRRPVPHVARTAYKQKQVHSLEFSNDGETLLFANWSGSLTRWGWKDPELTTVTLLVGKYGVYRYGGVASSKCFLLGTEHGVWRFLTNDIWKDDFLLSTWEEICTAMEGTTIKSITTSPTNGYALIACIGPANASLRVYNCDRDELDDEWTIPLPDPGNFINHIAISADNKAKAIAFGRGEILFSTGAQVFAHEGGAYHAVFVQNGNALATCGNDGTCALWDLQGKLIRRIELLHGPAECMIYCEGKDLLFIGHRTGIVSYLTLSQSEESDSRSGAFVPGVHGWVLCMAISQDDALLAVAGRSGVVTVFETETIFAHDQTVWETQAAPPIQQVTVSEEPPGCYFMDSTHHFHSTLKTRHSSYLPLRCSCACADTARGVLFAAMPEELRVLRANTGEPIACHDLPNSARLSMTLSATGDILAVLERKTLAVYQITQDYSRLDEIARVPFDHLLEKSHDHLPVFREHLPIVVCNDNQHVVVPIERVPLIHMAEDKVMSSPDESHELGIVSIGAQRITERVKYAGYCTALTTWTDDRSVLIGLGSISVRVVQSDEPEVTTGTVLSSCLEPRVQLLDANTYTFSRAYGCPPADLGVTSITMDTSSMRVVVTYRSGRTRLLTVPDLKSVCSICLDHATMASTFTAQGSHVLIADDGNGTAFLPVVHTFEVCSPS